MSSHYLQFQEVAIDRVEQVEANMGFKERKHHSSQALATSMPHDRSQLQATLKARKSTPTDAIERLHANGPASRHIPAQERQAVPARGHPGSAGRAESAPVLVPLQPRVHLQ
ncbi:hypothetical protein MRX96_019115 [Rhipicephalus microplus]